MGNGKDEKKVDLTIFINHTRGCGIIQVESTNRLPKGEHSLTTCEAGGAMPITPVFFPAEVGEIGVEARKPEEGGEYRLTCTECGMDGFGDPDALRFHKREECHYMIMGAEIDEGQLELNL